MEVCKYFLQGRCSKGDLCRYEHNLLFERVEAPPCLALPQDTRTQLWCRFYARGHCIYGNSCRYSLSSEAIVSSRPRDVDSCEQGRRDYTHAIPAAPGNFQDDLERDNFSRLFSGAVAHFEAGSLVSKVLFPWESSAVRLNGLPANSTRESVSALLQDLGFQVSSGSIRTWKETTDARTANAHVNIEDAVSSKDICSKLSEAVYPGLDAF